MSSQLLQDIASIATAAGVMFAGYQLVLQKRQAQSAFEDGLTAQFRSILAELPLSAMLGQTLSDTDLQRYLPAFYRYFDLSNEQAFLFKAGRVRKSTWSMWLEGIEQNLARPAFQQAWVALAPHLDGSFDELKPIALRRVPKLRDQ